MNSSNKKKIYIYLGGHGPPPQKDERVSTTIVYCKKLFLFVVSVNGNHQRYYYHCFEVSVS